MMWRLARKKRNKSNKRETLKSTGTATIHSYGLRPSTEWVGGDQSKPGQPQSSTLSLLLGRLMLCGHVCILVLLLFHWWLLAEETPLSSTSLLQSYQLYFLSELLLTVCSCNSLGYIILKGYVASLLDWEEVERGVRRCCCYTSLDKHIWSFLGIFLHLFSLAYHFSWTRRKRLSGLEALLLLVSLEQTSLHLLKKTYWTVWGFISHSLYSWSLIPGDASMKPWMDLLGMLAFLLLHLTWLYSVRQGLRPLLITAFLHAFMFCWEHVQAMLYISPVESRVANNANPSLLSERNALSECRNNTVRAVSAQM